MAANPEPMDNRPHAIDPDGSDYARRIFQLLRFEDEKSERASPQAAARALLVLGQVPADARCSFPPPYVTITGDGGFQIEWHDEVRHFEVEIPDSGPLVYAAQGRTGWSDGQLALEQDVAQALEQYWSTPV
ncbi:MAG: hypothetical protein WEB00_02425 [Dehalococcoidia bacterium]